MRSMARRANYRDVICKVTRPSRAKQKYQIKKIIKKKKTRIPLRGKNIRESVYKKYPLRD